MKWIALENLSKSFEGSTSPALENISFSLRKGEVLSLLGESGSGKTTLLKILAGLQDPSSGKVLFKGEPLKGPKDRLIPGNPDIELVHQNSALLEKRTVEENLLYHVRNYQPGYQQKRVKELIELCKLTELAKRFPENLSGGEKQRTAIACAMANEPSVILMDEPFSSLDIMAKQLLKEQLYAIIRETGITAILVTHDSFDALSMSDYVAVLRKGRLIQFATPEKIYEQPQDPYVANLFPNANILSSPFLDKYLPELPRYSEYQRACIRAEHVHICSSKNAHFTATIEYIEFLGLYYLLKLKAQDGTIITVHSTESYFKKGMEIPLKIDLEKIHLFIDG